MDGNKSVIPLPGNTSTKTSAAGETIGRTMATQATIETTTLSFLNMHEHGALFVNLLKARRDSFIVKNQWVLPEAEGLEYDQYDNPSSRWVAVHRGDKVLAGVRLTPTTARCGMYSYMIRDAQLNLLTSIPSNLLDFEAPVDPDIWEASRIFVAGDVPARLRTRVQTMLMGGLIKAAAENGAKQLMGLVPAVWPRWIGRIGLQAQPAGPVLEVDGRRNQVAQMRLPDLAKMYESSNKAQSFPFAFKPLPNEMEKRNEAAKRLG